jgi:hypothetical protein
MEAKIAIAPSRAVHIRLLAGSKSVAAASRLIGQEVTDLLGGFPPAPGIEPAPAPVAGRQLQPPMRRSPSWSPALSCKAPQPIGGVFVQLPNLGLGTSDWSLANVLDANFQFTVPCAGAFIYGNS